MRESTKLRAHEFMVLVIGFDHESFEFGHLAIAKAPDVAI